LIKKEKILSCIVAIGCLFSSFSPAVYSAESEKTLGYFKKKFKQKQNKRLRKSQHFENPQECLDIIQSIYSEIITEEYRNLFTEIKNINKGINELIGLKNRIRNSGNRKKHSSEWKKFLKTFNRSLWDYYEILNAFEGKWKDFFEVVQHAYHYLKSTDLCFDNKKSELGLTRGKLVTILTKIYECECLKIYCKSWLQYIFENSSLKSKMFETVDCQYPDVSSGQVEAMEKVAKWYEQLHGNGDDKYELLFKVVQ